MDGNALVMELLRLGMLGDEGFSLVMPTTSSFRIAIREAYAGMLVRPPFLFSMTAYTMIAPAFVSKFIQFALQMPMRSCRLSLCSKEPTTIFHGLCLAQSNLNTAGLMLLI
jgi:hypothetical protein